MIETRAVREPRPQPKMANTIVSSNRLHRTYVSVDIEAAHDLDKAPQASA